MDLIDYFDRLYIIHLPEREDRYRALKQELAFIGIDITASKVRIPDAPRPEETNGFPSRSVYGNFLSHLEAFRESAKDNLEGVWILEDDAIFRRCLRRKDKQEKLVQQLASSDWDLCYLGHPLKSELRGYPFGLVPFSKGFKWIHCYCVNGRVLDKLVQYLEETMINPPGHPRGGRMYMDGALTLFRRFHPEVVRLVSHPSLSTQKGSISSLAGGHWYDHLTITKPLVTAARSVRDEIWRWSY
ncbi:glycosyltransferase family 25 protein [Coleofasciculus chthonoplastes]|jgi:glycosyl transferase family 25|uniref:glycosyltransferase family 25 protein n=1 Tax=Coleofasciculus chthonoplastes TaxID=64178 RepID=UPI00330208E1